MSDEIKSNEYDLEPVKYCSRCCSLKIKYDEYIDDDYCVDCGCTDIVEAPITEWEKVYERRYGHKFTEKETPTKNVSVYKMSIFELKKALASTEIWRTVINRMYPKIPTKLNKVDAIFLLFDKAIKDNRMTELRDILATKL